MKLVSIAIAACVVPLFAAPGFCQDTTSPAPPQRGYMTAIGGASTGAQNTALIGAEYGDQMGNNAQAYATFSYHDNILQKQDHDTLAQMSQAVSLATGNAYRFSARDRAMALTLGAKYLVPTGAAIRPYVGAGAGMLNVKRTISEALRGDVTPYFYNEIGTVGGVVEPFKTSTTRPLGELLVGVGIAAGRAYVDVGYRYRKVFNTGTPFDFNQVAVGVGMRF